MNHEVIWSCYAENCLKASFSPGQPATAETFNSIPAQCRLLTTLRKKPFPTMFSTISKTKIVILATCKLLSPNDLNLVLPKKLSLGKDSSPLFKDHAFHTMDFCLSL